MIWNSENSTYHDRGKRTYGHGDKIPAKVIEEMGKETLDEYMEKGWIVDGKAAVDAERDAKFAKAEGYGLKPHYKAGIPKLDDMIEEFEALQAVKKEASELGIEPREGMTSFELTALVKEKKAANEPDS